MIDQDKEEARRRRKQKREEREDEGESTGTLSPMGCFGTCGGRDCPSCGPRVREYEGKMGS